MPLLIFQPFYNLFYGLWLIAGWLIRRDELELLIWHEQTVYGNLMAGTSPVVIEWGLIFDMHGI